MSGYFIVMISMDEAVDRAPYDSYIALVKPIVERFGGEYLVRTEVIDSLSPGDRPDRMIIIRFPDRERLNACFASEEYRRIMALRVETVRTKAFIAEGL